MRRIRKVGDMIMIPSKDYQKKSYKNIYNIRDKPVVHAELEKLNIAKTWLLPRYRLKIYRKK